MTRTEILEAYDVDAHGIIRSPGEFESEMLYVPYFWEASMDGSADELIWADDTSTYVVLVDKEDIEQFPELAGVYAVSMAKSDTGFVNSLIYSPYSCMSGFQPFY